MTIEIFEKHPTADAYKVGAAFTEYCILAKEKRFSDAELVAEYHSQQMEAVRAVARADPWSEGAWDELGRAEARIYLLEAFSTRPHAHETDYR